MFGLSGEKLLILGILAVIVLGPERLPEYAKGLANIIKNIRRMADGAKTQISEELGEDLDWRQLDPRQYDPRRIIREALTEDLDFTAEKAALKDVASVATGVAAVQYLEAGEKPPFDSEAT
ncbi:MAG: sec-independent translocase [Micrococcales bacterium]